MERTRGLQDDPNHHKRYNAPPCPVTNCIIPTSACNTCTCRTCVKMRVTRLEEILPEGTIFYWGNLMCLKTPFTQESPLGTSLNMPSTSSGQLYVIVLINSPSQDCVPSHSIAPLLLKGGSYFYPLRGTSAPTFFNNFSLQTTPSSNCHTLKDGMLESSKPAF